MSSLISQIYLVEQVCNAFIFKLLLIYRLLTYFQTILNKTKFLLKTQKKTDTNGVNKKKNT